MTSPPLRSSPSSTPLGSHLCSFTASHMLKMRPPNCLLMSLLLLTVDGFTVRGPSASLVAPLGSSAVLPCCVTDLSLMENLKVEWRRTDSETLVHLYQDGESHKEVQQQDYHGRAHFFPEEIQHGNFSLRLDDLRAEDEGRYTCRVYCQQESGETGVEIKIVERVLESGLDESISASGGEDVTLNCSVDSHITPEHFEEVSWRKTAHNGFSVVDIIMMTLCASASGSALLLCCLIYCRTPEKDTAFRLQLILVFCPNIMMCVAFALWGLSEGSLFESVSCSALYFLRPLMLLWTAPYVNEFTGRMKTVVRSYSFDAEYVFFTAVLCSVLFKSALDKGFQGPLIISLLVTVLLLNLIFIIFLLDKLVGKLSKRIQALFKGLSHISIDALPSLQLMFLLSAFGYAERRFFYVAFVPVFLAAISYMQQLTHDPTRLEWIISTLLFNAAMAYIYTLVLKNEEDCIGWACVIAFLQLLSAVTDYSWSFESALHRVVPVYVFGSVGVVLLNSVTLIKEIILKTVFNSVGDLRIVVFSSEFFFTFFLLLILILEPWLKPSLQSHPEATNSHQTPAAGSQNHVSQNAAGSDETPVNESNRNQNTESHEMSHLMNKQTQEMNRSDVTQPDSVVSQT